jgi:hypothetical protein
MNVVSGNTITNYPHILFNQTPDFLRRIGACGCRAHTRNYRARIAASRQARANAEPDVHEQSTAEAIAGS